LRDSYPKLKQRGAEVVVVGTGNADHARAFIADDGIPFPVLVDDDAAAAKVATIKRVWFHQLFHPDSYPATLQAWRDGHRIGKPGKRTTQLGATFVIRRGGNLAFEYRDAHAADHAPMAEVLAALGGSGQ
jgi:peroxiredoxin